MCKSVKYPENLLLIPDQERRQRCLASRRVTFAVLQMSLAVYSAATALITRDDERQAHESGLNNLGVRCQRASKAVAVMWSTSPSWVPPVR
ncbi:hypothetical protein M405DRAFT_830373 [Rhizopogon salebrosus TDB-379]|nr:hypothetical protein M405DRAFT_830373 [Rhizopogon salebrosus TDB-379]